MFPTTLVLTRHFSLMIILHPDGRRSLIVAHDHLQAPLHVTSLCHPIVVHAHAFVGAHACVHHPWRASMTPDQIENRRAHAREGYVNMMSKQSTSTQC